MKTRKDIINEILHYGAQRCLDAVSDGVECADLHQQLYNMDYYTIGRHEATQELAAFGTFDAIGIIQKYENAMFGEVTTDLTEPERIINMLAYIIGESALNHCPTVGNNWDDRLDTDTLKTISSELLELVDSCEFAKEIEA